MKSYVSVITCYKLMVVIILFSIGLFLVNSPGYAREVRGVTPDTVKVGMICDLTGPSATTWKFLLEGIRNYLRHMNDQGGINGRKVRLIVEDDRYTIPMAFAAFKKLVYRDEILCFMGPGSTPATVALLPQIEKTKMPNLQLPSSDVLVIPPKRYHFNIGATYEDATNIIFDYIVNVLKKKNPRIAITYPDNEFGKISLRTARDRAKFYGIKLVSEEVLNFGSIEATSEVLKIKRAKPDFVINAGIIESAVCLLRDSRKYDLQATFIGTFYTCSEDTIRIAKEAARNFIGIHAFSSWYDDTPGMAKLREITLKLHPGTEKPYRSKFYTMGWTEATILTEGIKRAGKDLDGERLVAAWETIRNFDTKGLTGPITYGIERRKGGEYCKIFKADVDKEILIPISEWVKPLE